MPASSDRIRVAILGAGPAGLTAALALETYAPDAFETLLFDKNRSTFDYPGVEYGIQARACRALTRLGHWEAATRRGLPTRALRLVHAPRNHVGRPVQLDPEATKAVVRQEFLADLAALVQHTAIRRQHTVTALQVQADHTVVVTTQDPSGGPTSHPAFDCVIACDGSRGMSRAHVFPDHAERIDQGFSFIYLLTQAPGETEVPDRFRSLANEGVGEFVMGRCCTFAVFPLGADRLAIAIGFDHATQARMWSRHGLAPETHWASVPSAAKRAIALAFADDVASYDDVFATALSYVSDWDSPDVYLWTMRDTDALRNPFPDRGNLILIGDAAHAMMPTIGMGATLAIEDAERLARRIADLGSSADRAAFRAHVRNQVFRPYARERYPIWADLIDRARQAARDNFIGQSRRRGFKVAAYIPSPLIRRVVTVVERIQAAVREG